MLEGHEKKFALRAKNLLSSSFKSMIPFFPPNR